MKNTSGPIIQLEEISKIHTTEEVQTHALAKINLNVYTGEYLALLGPSGCGKSSMLSILGLLDNASSGRYILNGKDTSTLSGGEKAKIRNKEIGFIFQNFNLIGDLSIIDNVKLPLIYRGHDVKSARAIAEESLSLVGMSNRCNHFPTQLSGGQQQRAAIARAIVGKPSVLLADEPTGNLDSENGEIVMELLAGLHHAGTTICMVTHDPRYLGSATRKVYLQDGKIDEIRNAA